MAWRARAYFVIALVFWLVSGVFPALAPKDPPWWVGRLFRSVGSLDKVSYLVLGASALNADDIRLLVNAFSDPDKTMCLQTTEFLYALRADPRRIDS